MFRENIPFVGHECSLHGEKTINTYDYEENTHDHFEQANNSSEDEPFTELTEIWAH